MVRERRSSLNKSVRPTGQRLEKVFVFTSKQFFLRVISFLNCVLQNEANDSMGDDDGQYFVSLEKSSSVRSIAPVN